MKMVSRVVVAVAAAFYGVFCIEVSKSGGELGGAWVMSIAALVVIVEILQMGANDWDYQVLHIMKIRRLDLRPYTYDLL